MLLQLYSQFFNNKKALQALNDNFTILFSFFFYIFLNFFES